jgi:hypothetical protein
MIQRKQDQFEKNPKNPPLKKRKKVLSRLSRRLLDEQESEDLTKNKNIV